MKNDVYRGNKPITVGELQEFLASFPKEKEVTFYTQSVETGDSFGHVESLEEFPEQTPWITLCSR